MVDLDVVAERCQSLKLVHAAECLAELVEEASREELSPVKFLDRVLEREIERKDERRIATSLKLSGLPVGKTLEGFDWSFQPAADRSKLGGEPSSATVRSADRSGLRVSRPRRESKGRWTPTPASRPLFAWRL